ncbi:MAG: aminotransferase class I/II-fold pyridoxal phosphate-dependent enzyme [Oscillospiraceae bacterium]|nr:aminotransferase class I/II-fold pyridoxal phosphate-dependent enzyme [Oscillospiraceae bacterium]
MKFSRRMDRFGDEIFASLNEKKLALEQSGRTIFNLSIGTPDFVPDQRLRDSLAEAAQDSNNWKYALRDLPEMTEAVCRYYKKRFGVEITPDMVCSCYGTQEGMGHLALTLCDEGDIVLLPTPCYPVFLAGAAMAGAEPFFYPLNKENGFLPNIADIPAEIADKAKFMVVSLPSNPTGSVAVPGTYEKLIAFAAKHDIILVHDNAYSDIIFTEEKGGSFLAYPGAAEVGAEFFSLSKSFNLTGARISFLVGRPDIVAAFRKLRSQIDFGMFLPIQKVAITALNMETDGIDYQRRLYRERRDALCGGCRAIGWDVADSMGSMFVWAPIPEHYADSMSFCMDLLEKAGVLCTPGSSFGPLGEGYVRFALVLPPERIKEALKAIADSGILNF